MRPEFSVVIPSYNHARYIGGAIESVISQTFKDWELIIIDDGSPDNSVELIKQYKDPRIRLLTQENHDAPYTINRGMKEAKGNYISILNSDDLFESNKLEECRKYLVEGNDFVFGKLKAIDENNNPMSEKDERVVWINRRLNNSNKPDTLEKLLQNINYLVTTSNFAFSRKVLEKVGFFHEKLHIAHDFDYLIRIFEKGLKIKFIPKYLTDYRMHSDNTLSKGRNEAYLEPTYSIVRIIRNNPEMRGKMISTILAEPVFSDAVIFYLMLADDEIERIVDDKNDPNRKKLLNKIEQALKKSPFFHDATNGVNYSQDIPLVVKQQDEVIRRLNKELYEMRSSLRWKASNFMYKKIKKLQSFLK